MTALEGGADRFTPVPTDMRGLLGGRLTTLSPAVYVIYGWGTKSESRMMCPGTLDERPDFVVTVRKAKRKNWMNKVSTW